MILDGRSVADLRNAKLKEIIKADLANNKSAPNIKIIIVGNDLASKTYTNQKIKYAKEVLIDAEIVRFEEDASEAEVMDRIIKFNNNPDISGILLQLPLPKHMDEAKLTNLIDYRKDIDGFTLINQGKLFQKQKGVRPATPQGILNLIDHYEIDVAKLDVVVIGRSQIVGMPIAKMLLDRDATVTICHSKTKDLTSHLIKADLIVAAVGRPLMIEASMIKKGVIIIDVGINHFEGKLVGDVDYNSVKDIVKYITPVPKGVGPMTINALLENAYLLKNNYNFK